MPRLFHAINKNNSDNVRFAALFNVVGLHTRSAACRYGGVVTQNSREREHGGISRTTACRQKVAAEAKAHKQTARNVVTRR